MFTFKPLLLLHKRHIFMIPTVFHVDTFDACLKFSLLTFVLKLTSASLSSKTRTTSICFPLLASFKGNPYWNKIKWVKIIDTKQSSKRKNQNSKSNRQRLQIEIRRHKWQDNMNLYENQRWNQVLRKDKHFLLCMRHPSWCPQCRIKKWNILMKCNVFMKKKNVIQRHEAYINYFVGVENKWVITILSCKMLTFDWSE